MNVAKVFRVFLITLFIGAYASAAQGALVTLHEDDFSHITTGNNTSTSSSSTSYTGEVDGIHVYTTYKAYPAGGAVKLGTGSLIGSLTTTNLMMQAGTVRVQVDVKGWMTVEGDLVISVAGQTTNLAYTATITNAFETLETTFEVEAGAHAVTFGTSAKRAFIDALLVTQDVVASEDKPVFSVAFNSESSDTVQETEAVAFTVSAAVNNVSVPVTFTSGLPGDASYTFTDGTFSWTPEFGHAGDYALVFSALDANDLPATCTVNITVLAYPMTAPVLTAEHVTARTFDVFWEPVPAATEGYIVNVWSGSGATNTPACDAEPFYAIADSGVVTSPAGWIFSGVKEKYTTPDFVELKFDDANDYIVTKTYPNAVTELNFRIRWVVSGKPAITNNVLTVYGSTDGGAWTLVRSYKTEIDEDGEDTDTIFSDVSKVVDKVLTFSLQDGYRVFKFEYTTKTTGNIGFGKMSVVYDGCGTKFVNNLQNAHQDQETTSVSVVKARPCCDYYVMVGAMNSTETKTSILVVRTHEAAQETFILIQ